ncbi:MAG: hypothetical protein SPL72_08230, partial [Cyanobacteriota bacterium]|nr:hypothetical protein [Cyanobacteriota bacterium]
MNTVTEKNNDFSIQEKADIKSAANTINSEIETICQLRDGLDQTLTQALNLMQQAKGRIIVTGMGKS